VTDSGQFLFPPPSRLLRRSQLAPARATLGPSASLMGAEQTWRRAASGPNRRSKDGQSMSDLPGYFRRQLVPLLPRHRPLRCRDIWSCFRSWCDQAEAGLPWDCPCVGSLGSSERMSSEKPLVKSNAASHFEPKAEIGLITDNSEHFRSLW